MPEKYQFSEYEKQKWRDAGEHLGFYTPTKDNPLTELGQGWLLGINRVLGREEVLDRNRQWEAPPEGSTAHSVGYGLGCASPVLIPLCLIALWYAVWRLRKRWRLRRVIRAERAKREDAARVQALHELETGNLDPLAKAKAAEQSCGDAALAKSLYLRVRVEEMMREE